MRPSPQKSSPAPRPAERSAPVWGAERILFEDEWIVVVDKPAGLPSDRTLDPTRASVLSELEAYLSRRDGNPRPYLALHHRLDRDTSGVLLLVKNPKANAATGALFSQKTAQKTYHALALMPKPPATEAWEVRDYLGKVGRVGKADKFGAVRSGGDPAHTDFRLLEKLAGAMLVEALPRTGRTHQIRVHLAGCGYPILGDELYGGPACLRLASGAQVRFPRFFLHAAALAFPHPVTQAPTEVRSALPTDFARCLAELRQ